MRPNRVHKRSERESARRHGRPGDDDDEADRMTGRVLGTNRGEFEFGVE